MNEIKLITTDLDGTFLLDHATPHPDNVAAAAECRRQGIQVCACTGRPWGGARSVIRKGGLDGFCVVNNGAAIIETSTGKHRFRRRIDPQSVKQILSYGIETNAETMVMGHTTLYTYRPTANKVMDWAKLYSSVPESESLKVLFYDTLDEWYDACAEDVEKIDFTLDVHEDLEGVWDALNQITEVEITSSIPGNMEVSAKDGTKQNAISVLADIYKVDAENVMAFGDNFNDMSMIMWAGIGVAMGNADDRLKNMANYVTGTNVEGGVAQAINRLVLNK